MIEGEVIKDFQKMSEMLQQKDQQIAELKQQLVESEKRLKDIDNWKENYGYSNYEDIYMLEDLQSRAFQSEDDTTVVNELLDYLNISDENEILPTIKQQLAEKDKEYTRLHNELKLKCEYIREIVAIKDEYKQKLNTQSKEIVEKIRKEFEERLKNTAWNGTLVVGKVCNVINDVLDKILKEYEEK